MISSSHGLGDLAGAAGCSLCECTPVRCTATEPRGKHLGLVGVCYQKI
jgi:hypothetical protein